jgi:hypothetical protein
MEYRVDNARQGARCPQERSLSHLMNLYSVVLIPSVDLAVQGDNPLISIVRMLKHGEHVAVIVVYD